MNLDDDPHVIHFSSSHHGYLAFLQPGSVNEVTCRITGYLLAVGADKGGVWTCLAVGNEIPFLTVQIL